MQLEHDIAQNVHKKISFYYFLAYEANPIVATHHFHNKRGA